MEIAAVLRLVLAAFYVLLNLLPVSALHSAVLWTPDGVEKIQHKIKVTAGDRLTFLCPDASFSTIWFMESVDQYNDCSCDSRCILLSNCPYFLPYNYTTVIKTTSEPLQNTPSFRPGRTYFFASFAVDRETLSAPDDAMSGGECQDQMLRLQVEVEANDDSEMEGEPEDPSQETSNDATPPLVGSGLGDDGKPIGTDSDKEEEKEKSDPRFQGLSNSCSSSSPLLSSILTIPLLILATVHLYS